jgi:hypothetical protein
MTETSAVRERTTTELIVDVEQRAELLRAFPDVERNATTADLLDAIATRLADQERTITNLHREASQADDRENEMAGHMGDRWEDDVAQIAIICRFMEHYGDLDRQIDAAREEDDFEGHPLAFVWSDDEMTLVRAAHLDAAADAAQNRTESETA